MKTRFLKRGLGLLIGENNAAIFYTLGSRSRNSTLWCYFIRTGMNLKGGVTSSLFSQSYFAGNPSHVLLMNSVCSNQIPNFSVGTPIPVHKISVRECHFPSYLRDHLPLQDLLKLSPEKVLANGRIQGLCN